MQAAWIGGTAAALDAAVQEAAALLGGARLPLVAGLGTDIAGATAAVALARRLRGVLDHVHSPALLRDLEVMQRSGWIVTTPPEARARADVVVLAGPGLGPGREGLEFLAGPGDPPLWPGVARRIFRLCPDEGTAEDLAGQTGLIRMLVAGRSVTAQPALQDCAAALRAAHYGVIVWSASHLAGTAVEALCGLVEALNQTTRCAGLPLSPGDNAAGVLQAVSWLTGYPLPVGFGRGVPEHDPWRFDATRLAESGEADAALWISALAPDAPPWRRRPRLVALVPPDAPADAWLSGAEVAIIVGRPGVAHDAVLHDARLATLTARPASAPAALPSVAQVLAAIDAALPPC